MIGHGGRLETGTTKVVITCDVLSEGWDLSAAKCAILARPTESLVVYLQQVGRILRPHGIAIPLILDHAGNVGRHRVPWLERPWSLETAVPVVADGSAPMRRCPECGAIQPINDRTCPECGHTVPPITKEPDSEAGELVEVHALTADRRKEIEANVRAVARQIGADESWIAKTLPLALGEQQHG
jgi:superfamily II DNA or RNA helicase